MTKELLLKSLAIDKIKQIHTKHINTRDDYTTDDYYVILSYEAQQILKGTKWEKTGKIAISKNGYHYHITATLGGNKEYIKINLDTPLPLLTALCLSLDRFFDE